MATIEQLTTQVAILTQKLNEHSQQILNINHTKFNLTADQIIRNFNEIPPFSGEDSFKLKSFLKSVEDAELLCGENNSELRQYCLKKIINGKIIGSARHAILEIPDHKRTWNIVVSTLIQKFRPKQTIHQLLFKAKSFKVFNLKDLFNRLSNIKSEASEICDFENEDIFTYESIDKELVQILKTKIIPLLQVQIDNNKTLFELDNFFCQSEVYLTEDVIKTEYRITKTNSNFDRKNLNGKNKRNNHQNIIKPNQTFNNNFNNTYPNRNYSGQYRNQNFNNRSTQFRNKFQNRHTNYTYNNNQNNNNNTEAMEIDTINFQTNNTEEVNFTN